MITGEASNKFQLGVSARYTIPVLSKIPILGGLLLFFGFAKSFGYQLCLSLGLSSNFSDLFLILPYVLTLILLVFFSRKTRSPRAIGQFFDKGRR